MARQVTGLVQVDYAVLVEVVDEAPVDGERLEAGEVVGVPADRVVVVGSHAGHGGPEA